MPTLRWPVLVWRDDAPLRLIIEDFTCRVDGVEYTVPAGYDAFNGASIPRWLWSSIGHPYLREFERAALVHDYFYDSPEGRERHGIEDDDRKAVDRIFERQLIADGVAPAKARLMFWAVDRFGASRFTCSSSTGLAGMDAAQVRALELDDCDCAEREAAEMLASEAAEDEDGRLLRAGLALLDFGRIRANLESFGL